MDCVLEVKNVSKKIKNADILNNISFTMKKGEIVGLIGENGAGKTSIMRILAGLTKKFTGTVCWTDADRVGCLIETPNFYPYMTGKENLEYMAALKNVPGQEAEALLEELGLEEASGKKVKGYSLGMRQRLGIAQALLGEPEVLVLDEPTNGLDPSGIREVREYLRKLAEKRGISILISSHALSEIERLCGRALMIRKGELQREIKIQKQGDTQYLRLVTSDNEKVFQLLQEEGFSVVWESDSLKLQVNEQEKKQALALIQESNLFIVDINQQKVGLEDQYMNSIREV